MDKWLWIYFQTTLSGTCFFQKMITIPSPLSISLCVQIIVLIYLNAQINLLINLNYSRELSRPASDLRRILDRIERLIKYFEPIDLPAIVNKLMILFSKIKPIRTIETLRDYFLNAQKLIESENCSGKYMILLVTW